MCVVELWRSDRPVPDMRMRESRSTDSGGHGLHASTFEPVASGGIQASSSVRSVLRNDPGVAVVVFSDGRCIVRGST